MMGDQSGKLRVREQTAWNQPFLKRFSIIEVTAGGQGSVGDSNFTTDNPNMTL